MSLGYLIPTSPILSLSCSSAGLVGWYCLHCCGQYFKGFGPLETWSTPFFLSLFIFSMLYLVLSHSHLPFSSLLHWLLAQAFMMPSGILVNKLILHLVIKTLKPTHTLLPDKLCAAASARNIQLVIHSLMPQFIWHLRENEGHKAGCVSGAHWVMIMGTMDPCVIAKLLLYWDCQLLTISV